jgi:hypothetical protein
MHLQPAPRTASRPHEPVDPGLTRILARGVAITALTGIALVHLVQLPDTAHQMPGLAVLFGLLTLTTAALASALVHSDNQRVWQVAALTSTAALAGYILTRSAAMPLDNGDVGNWLEPLGLVALFIEAALLALCCYRLRPGPSTFAASGTARMTTKSQGDIAQPASTVAALSERAPRQ